MQAITSVLGSLKQRCFISREQYHIYHVYGCRLYLAVRKIRHQFDIHIKMIHNCVRKTQYINVPTLYSI